MLFCWADNGLEFKDLRLTASQSFLGVGVRCRKCVDLASLLENTAKQLKLAEERIDISRSILNSFPESDCRVIVSPSSIAIETIPHTLATLETPSIANGEWKRHEDKKVGNGQVEKETQHARWQEICLAEGNYHLQHSHIVLTQSRRWGLHAGR